MLRKFLVSLPLMIALLAAGAGFAYLLISTKPPPVRRETPTATTRVQAYPLERQAVVETFHGSGTARPDEAVTLSAQVGGKIVEVAKGLEDGSKVTKGQLLLRIEEADYQHQLDRAKNLIKADQATLKQIEIERKNIQKLIASAKQDVQITEDEYSRVARLFEDNLAAKREFDLVRSALLRTTREVDNLESRLAQIEPRRMQTEASLDAHKAEVRIAELNLSRCRIESPFDGQVRRRVVEQNETVAPGQPLIQLLKLDRVEVPVELPASLASKVKIDTPCKLHVESLENQTWHGTIERLSPLADEKSRTFTAYVTVDNTDQSTPLIPGMFVQAEITGPEHADALVVPRGAIRNDTVYVAEDGKARRRPIELHTTLEDRAIIAQGVDVGDAIILTNLASLYDGAPIYVDTAASTALANGRADKGPTSQAVETVP